MSKATTTELKSASPDALKDYLLAEHESLRDAFWRNEELGERRLQFFIGLVTAVFGGLGLLATAEKGFFNGSPERIAWVAAGGLVFLLLVGLMTLGRMNKRDRVSDEYKLGLDQIRNCFLRNPGKVCPSLPEPLEPRWPLGGVSPVRVGWLARLVITVNAIITGTLALDIAYLRSGKLEPGVWAVPLAVAAAWVIQWLLSTREFSLSSVKARFKHKQE